LEGEDLDVHNIANDFKDLYPKSIDLVVHCNVVLLVSALPIIGPPINAFPATAPPANAHPITVPPTSALLALPLPITVPPTSALLALPLSALPFSTIDLAIVATNDSCAIIDDECVPHKLLPKSWFFLK
jgi:hypothetical protein